MHLRSISMKGFKSFPSRTKLEFGTGVSVIVGPNGSGKSNITDAVLWALGEQSPLAVRGQSMKDVIFAGAHGVQGSNAAEVEVVIDNGDGALDIDFSEISIVRRLGRDGEGEYRLNGARCRLVDVVEVLSDSGLGKEMHSVVSQGKVEQIVMSRPRERRLLIEEAAGLGKHRKRRRRAQLKLERTEENLSRALDVEREARSRLRPLKRQAEAAELHERLERQTLEARYSLSRDAARERAAGAGRGGGARAQRARRARRGRAPARRGGEAPRAGRGGLRRADARPRAPAGAAVRGALGERADRHAPRAGARAGRGGARAARAAAAPARGARAAGRRRRRPVVRGGAARRTGSPRSSASWPPSTPGASSAWRASWRASSRSWRARARAFPSWSRRPPSAAAPWRPPSGRRRRRARRAATQSAPPRPHAPGRPQVGAELAAVNQFVRGAAARRGRRRAAAGRAPARREPGYELALAAVLGPRLTAAVVNDRIEGERVLDAAGQNGASVLLRVLSASLVRTVRRAAGVPASPSVPGGQLLAHLVRPERDVAALAERLLAGVWVVESLGALPESFSGVAVTKTGRLFDARTGELAQAPAGGAERLLEELGRRDELVTASERPSPSEAEARAALERHGAAVAEADSARESAESALRIALREAAEAEEIVSRSEWVIARRRETPDDGPEAVRRAELLGDLRAEQRLAERIEREREERARALAALQTGAERDLALAADADRAAERARERMRGRRGAARRARRGARGRGRRGRGDRRRAKSCAQEEAELQGRLKRASEAVTAAEVAAQQVRDSAADAERDLNELAGRLGLEPEPAAEALPDEERESLLARVERLMRRREQLGPVNPLAKQEYDEAVAHVEELETQRGDLETALAELEGLIKETDRRIREAFEQTFEAAAKNFEEVVQHLFPGGRGQLRLVQEEMGPRPVVGGEPLPDGEAPEPAEPTRTSSPRPASRSRSRRPASPRSACRCSRAARSRSSRSRSCSPSSSPGRARSTSSTRSRPRSTTSTSTASSSS